MFEKLTSLGYRCWLDIHQMGGGDSLYDKIDRGLRGSHVLVSCVTDKYSLSLNCRREIALADAIKKPIIPLLLESMSWPPAGPMSMPLSQLTYINYVSEADLINGEKFTELLQKLASFGIGQPSPTVPKEKPNKLTKAPESKPAVKEPRVTKSGNGSSSGPASNAASENGRSGAAAAEAKPAQKSSSCNIL